MADPDSEVSQATTYVCPMMVISKARKLRYEQPIQRPAKGQSVTFQPLRHHLLLQETCRPFLSLDLHLQYDNFQRICPWRWILQNLRPRLSSQRPIQLLPVSQESSMDFPSKPSSSSSLTPFHLQVTRRAPFLRSQNKRYNHPNDAIFRLPFWLPASTRWVHVSYLRTWPVFSFTRRCVCCKQNSGPVSFVAL